MQTPCQQELRGDVQGAAGRMVPACFRQGTPSCVRVRLGFSKCRTRPAVAQQAPGRTQPGAGWNPLHGTQEDVMP